MKEAHCLSVVLGLSVSGGALTGHLFILKYAAPSSPAALNNL